MLREYKEDSKGDFAGTIIDIETVGDFDRQYGDSQRYRKIKPVIFGFITRRGLQIYCAVGKESISELIEMIRNTLRGLERPLYAFNADFERGVFFHSLGERIHFDGELNAVKWESKANACNILGIPNYEDPFNNDGFKCMGAWENGNFHSAVKHNRACLLKERDILLKRQFREPAELEFIK